VARMRWFAQVISGAVRFVVIIIRFFKAKSSRVWNLNRDGRGM